MHGYPTSPLSRIATKEPANEAELADMRRRAWHQQGIAVIRPQDITDDFARQAIVNTADKLYGKRG